MPKKKSAKLNSQISLIVCAPEKDLDRKHMSEQKSDFIEDKHIH